MNRISTLNRVAPVLRSFVLALVAVPSGAFRLTYMTIDFPGSNFTGAVSINSRDQIVGGYADASGTGHGFLLDRGTLTTIDPPGSTSTTADGINSRGQIVGVYTDAAGTTHGFMAQ
jgi:uncharacterized membrane protein